MLIPALLSLLAVLPPVFASGRATAKVSLRQPVVGAVRGDFFSAMGGRVTEIANLDLKMSAGIPIVQSGLVLDLNPQAAPGPLANNVLAAEFTPKAAAEILIQAAIRNPAVGREVLFVLREQARAA